MSDMIRLLRAFIGGLGAVVTFLAVNTYLTADVSKYAIPVGVVGLVGMVFAKKIANALGGFVNAHIIRVVFGVLMFFSVKTYLSDVVVLYPLPALIFGAGILYYQQEISEQASRLLG